MAHKNLFHNNPTQNAMENAYEEMLKEEHESGVNKNTATFFEDIIVESKLSPMQLAEKYSDDEDMRKAFVEGWKAAMKHK
jgi:hypothetical protein